MKKLGQFLKLNDFSKAARIIPAKGGLRHTFKYEPAFDVSGARGADCGWVYVWVSTSRKEPRCVLYVGKAGQTQTIKKRCNQHQRGFYSSGTGIKNAERIKKFSKENPSSEIWVYARHAAIGEMFGVAGVSLCEFEEMALIKKFKGDFPQLWNFSKIQS